MYENLLKENLRVELITADGSVKGALASRIEEVRSRSLIVAFPSRQGALVMLHLNQRLKVDFSVQDDAYTFESVVLSRIREPIPVLEIAKPTTITKIQRRNFVRFKTVIPVHFYRMKTEDELDNERKPEDCLSGQTVDISGGGTMIATKDTVEPNDLLEIIFEMPNRKPLVVLGKVIRVIPQGQGKDHHFNLAINFYHIRDNQQDVVISYIFEKQRELRKKGLL